MNTEEMALIYVALINRLPECPTGRNDQSAWLSAYADLMDAGHQLIEKINEIAVEQFERRMRGIGLPSEYTDE